jgi:patatin-like phospholipase/acyl hydrolase
MRRVLAIDGGGIRGVLPSSFLATIEENIEGNVVDYFDLVVGTSTGGIIALGLGAGLPATEIRDFYIDRGPQIFSGLSWLRKARRLATAKYGDATLRTALTDVFGDRRIGESRTRLVVPSMDVDSGKVHLWKTAHNPRFVQDYKLPMVDAALATAAAPTYFRAFRTEAGTPLMDGGVFANNPVGLAAVEAVGVLGWPRDEIAILSLGCGTEPLNLRTRGWWRSGIAGLALKLADVFMAAQSDASCGAAIHLLGDRNKFVRISPSLPAGRYGLDTTREVRSLAALGATEARRRLQDIETLFFAKTAERFEPDNRLD